MTNTLPPVGTEVLVKHRYRDNWETRYVSGYTHGDRSTHNTYGVDGHMARLNADECKRQNKIVANGTKGEYHGAFYKEDERKYADAKDDPASTYGMKDEDVKALVRNVLKAARARGYCSEAENILADVGLPTTVPEVKTFTVEVEVTPGEVVDLKSFYDLDDMNVVSVNETD